MEETSTNIGWKSKRERGEREREEGGREIASGGIRGKVGERERKRERNGDGHFAKFRRKPRNCLDARRRRQ